MSTIAIDRLPPETRDHPPLVTKIDDRRGSGGMWLFVITEAALFVLLFFSYFYLAQGGWTWPRETPPKLHFAIPMLIVLWASSGVLYWGEKQVKKQKHTAGRTALTVTILLGIGFLVLSFFEYREHLGSLKPTTDVYGSIFYTIVSFHALHVITGLLMLGYVSILPAWEPVDRPPHRPFHNASIYWHFVDLVWGFVVALLYVAPNVR
ncbi:MAG TPA: heme-copper oxidase subunit III [Bryobacteraceae bacterium]|nr:heme-copper oxidase subunit III [Bryobacteraceae bacterium]